MKAFANHRSEGMDLRDYFAAKAMQGMFGADTEDNVISINKKAKISYKMADAMMKAREEKHRENT